LLFAPLIQFQKTQGQGGGRPQACRLFFAASGRVFNSQTIAV